MLQNAKWHDLLTKNSIRVVVDDGNKLIDVLENDSNKEIQDKMLLRTKSLEENDDDRTSYNNITCTDDDEKPSNASFNETTSPQIHSVNIQSDLSKEHLTFSQVNSQEVKRREAVWELFTTECVYLVDYLMVLKHVRI